MPPLSPSVASWSLFATIRLSKTSRKTSFWPSGRPRDWAVCVTAQLGPQPKKECADAPSDLKSRSCVSSGRHRLPGRPAGLPRRATCFSSAAVKKTDGRGRQKCNQKKGPKTYEAFSFAFSLAASRAARLFSAHPTARGGTSL